VPLIGIGYSLGGNVLLKYLGEEGRGAALAASVVVSTPLDLAAASQRLLAPRNRFYQDYLVTRMKVEALADPESLTSPEARVVQATRTVFDFDDRFVAPRHGFAGAADYYARCSASRYLDGIRPPTLVIHGLNDPWIPAAVYHAVPWGRLPSLTPLLPRGGGHVGFHGIDSRVAWHDRCAGLFVDRVVNQ
jgi:predicted alpha/beta-fold hydrolase